MYKENFFGMILVSLLALGCGTDDSDSSDLPKGFESAAKVEVAMGALWGEENSFCDLNTESDLEVTVVEGELRMAFTGCFHCAFEKQEAFVQKNDKGYEVLFQPVETDAINACGNAKYTLRLYPGQGKVGDTVAVHVRTSLDKEPELRAQAIASDEAADCVFLTPCDVENPCANEGSKMDERADDYTMGCTALPSCGGSFCIWDAEACMMECGGLGCAMAESFPLSPSC